MAAVKKDGGRSSGTIVAARHITKLSTRSSKSDLLQRIINGGFAEISPNSNRYNLRVVTPKSYSVPVIDLTGMDESSQQDRIMQELVAAACEWGCFQLVNHGISSELLDGMLQVTKDFFSMTEEEKQSFSCEEFAKGFGQSYRTVTGTTNWRQVFRHEVAPVTEDEIQQWPNKPENYQATTLQFSKKVTQISECLLALLSKGLGLERDYIVKAMGGQVTARLLLNSYPICPNMDDAYGLPSHTDPNCLTFLVQDQVGGLEAFHDGAWVPVKSLPSALTVNVSDHLQMLSNGKYKSVVHRVIINPKLTRTSIGVFVAPAQRARMGPAPELVSDQEPARYRPTTFAGYLKEYYQAGRDQTAVFERCFKAEPLHKT